MENFVKPSKWDLKAVWNLQGHYYQHSTSTLDDIKIKQCMKKKKNSLYQSNINSFLQLSAYKHQQSKRKILWLYVF